jgi:hypothetical protein
MSQCDGKAQADPVPPEVPIWGEEHTEFRKGQPTVEALMGQTRPLVTLLRILQWANEQGHLTKRNIVKTETSLSMTTKCGFWRWGMAFCCRPVA